MHARTHPRGEPARAYGARHSWALTGPVATGGGGGGVPCGSTRPLDALWMSIVQDHVYVAGLDAAEDGTKHVVHAGTIRLLDGDVVLAAGENGLLAAPTHADDARRAILVGTTIVTLDHGPDGFAVWTWDLADPATSLVRRPIAVSDAPMVATTEKVSPAASPCMAPVAVTATDALSHRCRRPRATSRAAASPSCPHKGSTTWFL